jgi:hypothetical protein
MTNYHEICPVENVKRRFSLAPAPRAGVPLTQRLRFQYQAGAQSPKGQLCPFDGRLLPWHQGFLKVLSDNFSDVLILRFLPRSAPGTPRKA